MNICRSPLLYSLLILFTGLSGCIEEVQPAEDTVEIRGFSFQPASITVPVGSAVTWINRDIAPHTVTAKDGSFSSGSIPRDGMFKHTFDSPGRFQYFCQIHPSMIGEVIVTPLPSANSSEGGIRKEASRAAIGLQLVAEDFTAPMAYISSGDGRMLLVDQVGLVRTVTEDGKVLDEPFLDIRDRIVKLSERYDERGLLGLALDPGFARNGLVYAFYSAPLREGAPEGWSCTNRLSRFRVSEGDPGVVDPTTEEVVLEVDKPQMNHNGGGIAFGPDGYLYLPLGDGGGAGDVGVGHAREGNAQNTTTLLGKILRIDVNRDGGAYGVPADNPFVREEGFLPEIWAYGLRNPWRIYFDRDGRLFVSDAGQNLWEEVDIVRGGGNYGWRIREGTHCFSPEGQPAGCADKGYRGEDLVDPVIEYSHDNRTVVVGGYIYNGSELSGLQGCYIFGDWSSSFAKGDGTLLIACPSEEGLWATEEISVSGSRNGRVNAYVRAFGEDGSGELYLMTSDVAGPSGRTGKVYRLVPAA
ncbi:MAG: PQQ-dependent sugar dehydrogenase [Methanothrix sp.]|nr:PQQ-dependent sugar dehydrogenase [Methanothrix sp.]